MKRLVALVFVLMASCSTPDLINENPETVLENLERRPEVVNCTETIIPENVDRQDVIDRLNQEFVIVNGFSSITVDIIYNSRDRQVQFSRLWNGGVQYAFTITDEAGNTVQDCITFNTISAVEVYDFRGRAGVYTVTFNGLPEVTREYQFEITRGR